MRIVSRILIALFVVMLVYVVQRANVMKLGYEVEGLKKEKKNLEQIHTSLLIERAALASTERIEKIATSYLGMKNPANDQIVLVKEGAGMERRPSFARADITEKGANSHVKVVKYINQRL